MKLLPFQQYLYFCLRFNFYQKIYFFLTKPPYFNKKKFIYYRLKIYLFPKKKLNFLIKFLLLNKISISFQQNLYLSIEPIYVLNKPLTFQQKPLSLLPSKTFISYQNLSMS
jgi:hypothetical protein